MTQQARNRRIGWLATLSVCLVFYVLLHLKVTAMHSQVAQAEEEIVRLEQRNILLETEVLTRSNQFKLAQWNRVEFGFHAPAADQYIDNERRLAQLGGPRPENAPAPIRLATITTGEHAPPFPSLNERRAGQPAANSRRAGAQFAARDRVRVELGPVVTLAAR